MRKDAPLSVDVPGPHRDNPGWVKVGVIAAVGFAVGIAWPRVVGVKLGPSAPTEVSSKAQHVADAASAATAKASPPAAVASMPASVAGSGAPAASAPATSAAAPAHVAVQKSAVLSCKTIDGDSKKGRECGHVTGLDALISPRLRKLASCAAAEGQSGKLSFVANVDFVSGKFAWEVGKSSTVGNVDGLTTCLKSIFQGVVLAGTAHEHPRYTVGYNTLLTPGAEKSAPKEDDAHADAKPEPPKGKIEDRGDGEASVAWEIALVRDVPKTGQVVARLPRGTKVKVGSSKDGWFSVKFGDNFGTDGWVYRAAIGR